MPSNSITRLLDQLDESKRRFAPGELNRTKGLLARLSRTKFSDAESLIRFHEALLFLAAYPQSAQVKHLTESLLKNFDKRVKALRNAEADISPLEVPEVSGIVGTSVTDTFSYYIVRWLVKRHPGQIALDWEWFEDENRLAETWPRLMPLLEEDASVEANVPYQTWLRAAKVRSVNEVAWLIRGFESLPAAEKEKAELYDAQKLYLRWTPAYRASRTGMRLPLRNIFYHRDELIRRRDLSFRRELEAPPSTLNRLDSKQGEAILDMAREASTVRYRELYGFTHGDPNRVFKTNLGRGVDLFVMGVPPGKRLPLRAYHAAMIFKNGVPVGYFEGLSLFERMESGFNLYYTFRDGETAWLYARTLNVFRHLLGVTAFSLDPYQLGYENEEGIESGAFWFYRKLGFRPTTPEVRKLVSNEEKKIGSRATYRTAARTLRKLVVGSMILELDKPPNASRSGDWDRFQVRNIGLRVQRRMADRFNGDAERMRRETVDELTQVLRIREKDWWKVEQPALSDFAVTLSLVEDLGRWSQSEKQALLKIIRVKATADESSYLKLMQKQTRLRRALIQLGS